MKFTIYSKDGCPYCQRIKTIMELSNLEHTVYDLEVDFTRDQFYDQFGYGATFPQVVLNDEMQLGGCTDTIMYLKEQNII